MSKVRGIAPLAIAVAALWLSAGPITSAAGTAALPPPAKKDLCANVFGGSIPYDHNRYHWFCSGVIPLGARKSTSFSLQCGPGRLDSRKRFSYWVSSPALSLTKFQWDPGYGELILFFHNASARPQKYEFWESCKGAS